MQKPYNEAAVMVVFGGVKYRRYPDSPHAHLRNYFWPSPNDVRMGVKALHVEIWKARHGDPPEGHHVHHGDGNSLNNAIENLVCLTPAEHNKIHYSEDVREACRRRMGEVRPLAIEWHRSDAGRKWHSALISARWAEGKARSDKCEQCGSVYETMRLGGAKFCSPKCRQKARRDSGADDVARTCAFCGIGFNINRHKKTACCSQSCAQRHRRNRGQS